MTLRDAWDRLSAVRSLRISARSNDRTSGWDGSGAGTVEVAVTGDADMTFTERGKWIKDSGKQFDFSNTYRWRFDWRAETIRLEHPRHDPNSPVFVLELAPTIDGTFRSLLPHRCGADLYTATVTFTDDGVHLQWYVRGQKKDAEIRCIYSAPD